MVKRTDLIRIFSEGVSKNRVENLGFYSNSVRISLQETLAQKLGDLAGLPEYSLFLTNSGSESTENALKLASFHTERKGIIVFRGRVHGRTSLAVEATDSTKIAAPVNITGNIIRLPLNDPATLEHTINESVAAIMVEGIQGLGGVQIPSREFLIKSRQLCDQYGAVLILDEIQSGYGRSGKFFAYQHNEIKPDIISVAKGMGNGFPIGGILIAPQFEVKEGILGTTFGGNHLACTAGIAVLDVIKEENLVENAKMVGTYFVEKLQEMDVLKEVRGSGLMIGIDLKEDIKSVRNKLLFKYRIFTGSSSNPHTLRILPPLNVTTNEVDYFIHSLKRVLS